MSPKTITTAHDRPTQTRPGDPSDLYDEITLEIDKVDALAELIENKLTDEDHELYRLAVVAECLRNKNAIVRAKVKELYVRSSAKGDAR